jgi:hypothetical protein
LHEVNIVNTIPPKADQQGDDPQELTRLNEAIATLFAKKGESVEDVAEIIQGVVNKRVLPIYCNAQFEELRQAFSLEELVGLVLEKLLRLTSKRRSTKVPHFDSEKQFRVYLWRTVKSVNVDPHREKKRRPTESLQGIDEGQKMIRTADIPPKRSKHAERPDDEEPACSEPLPPPPVPKAIFVFPTELAKKLKRQISKLAQPTRECVDVWDWDRIARGRMPDTRDFNVLVLLAPFFEQKIHVDSKRSEFRQQMHEDFLRGRKEPTAMFLLVPGPGIKVTKHPDMLRGAERLEFITGQFKNLEANWRVFLLSPTKSFLEDLDLPISLTTGVRQGPIVVRTDFSPHLTDWFALQRTDAVVKQGDGITARSKGKSRNWQAEALAGRDEPPACFGCACFRARAGVVVLPYCVEMDGGAVKTLMGLAGDVLQRPRLIRLALFCCEKGDFLKGYVALADEPRSRAQLAPDESAFIWAFMTRSILHHGCVPSHDIKTHLQELADKRKIKIPTAGKVVSLIRQRLNKDLANFLRRYGYAPYEVVLAEGKDGQQVQLKFEDQFKFVDPDEEKANQKAAQSPS